MNPDIEEAGALVTAGLAAGEIDRASYERRTGEQPIQNCSNCGALLTGRYCHACGQAGHIHRSLLHLVEEVLHNVLHFDAKGWRTLPLLIARPGVLTRRYIDGQRTRYVSPLALFLFSVFLMFFVFSMTAGNAPSTPDSSAQRANAKADLDKSIAEDNAEVARAATALAQARRTGVDDRPGPARRCRADHLAHRQRFVVPERLRPGTVHRPHERGVLLDLHCLAHPCPPERA